MNGEVVGPPVAWGSTDKRVETADGTGRAAGRRRVMGFEGEGKELGGGGKGRAKEMGGGRSGRGRGHMMAAKTGCSAAW